MNNVSLIATFAGAILGFLLGGLWYGPLFGKAWMTEQGWSSEKIEELKKSFNPLKVYGGNFVLGLAASYAFGLLVGPQPRLGYAIGTGLLVGAFCVSVFACVHLPVGGQELTSHAHQWRLPNGTFCSGRACLRVASLNRRRT